MYAKSAIKLFGAALCLVLAFAVQAPRAQAALLSQVLDLDLTVYNGSAGTFVGSMDIQVFDDSTVKFTFNNDDATGISSIGQINFEQDLGNIFKDSFIVAGPNDYDAGTMIGTEFSTCLGTTACAEPGITFEGNNTGVPNNPFGAIWAQADAIPPPSKTGINPGEMYMITFMFSGSAYTAQELAALITDRDGFWRIAIHIRNCDGEDSCNAFVTPIPGAVWLFASAILGLFGFGYRRKRRLAAA